jgi:hypothetical protein
MEPKLPEEDIIRRYLLGALSDPELSAIEQKLLSSEELSQTAGLIEDEIIEQYLDEDLDERDKEAVESHFLRPPAHREKLRFARLLRHHFEQGAADAGTVHDRVLVSRVPARSFWNYGGALASVPLAAVSLYLVVAQHGLKTEVAESHKAQAVLQAELNKEHESSASLREKLRALQATSVVSLDLRPGISRSTGFVPQAVIQPSTRFLKLDVVLPKSSAVSFRVRLLDRNTGYEVWSKSGLKPVPGASRLVFDMPVQGIRTGPYELIVSPVPEHGEQVSYSFEAHVTQ